VEIDKFQEKVLKLNQDFKFVLLSNIFNKNFQLLSRSRYLRPRNCRQDIYLICAIIAPVLNYFTPLRLLIEYLPLFARYFGLF